MGKVWLVGLACLMIAGPALAQSRPAPGSVPTADQGSVREPAGVPRYAGSVIVGGSVAAFDEVSLVTGPLVRSGDRRDGRNNALFRPAQEQMAEGRRTRLVYVVPSGRSPLEVVRGYEQAMAEKGGKRLYTCGGEACGGETRYGAGVGGNRTGIIHMLFPAGEIPGDGQPLACAVDNRAMLDQRFSLIELADGGFASVLAFTAGPSSNCKPWDGRTVAVVSLVETKAREQRMELVKADSMAGSLDRDGKVSLQAILFETASADIRPESEPQLAEILAFLRAQPALRVLVVGHTDSVGGVESNLDLSRRRAAAVVSTLVSRGIAASRLVPVGVGMAAPVTTNASEEGRQRNRRVELVKM